MKRCIIQWPGLVSPQSASYTLSHGVYPGVAEIKCNPVGLENIQLIGDLVMSDGESSVTVSGARIEKASGSFSTSEKSITLYLLDFRYQWKYQTIFGHYNVPMPRGYDVPLLTDHSATGQNTQGGNAVINDDGGKLPSVQDNTLKNARRLAILCLEAMGVTNFDVSAIPNNDYPEVNWDAANPAAELEALATRYGGRLAVRVDTQAVTVVKMGVGSDLPPAPPSILVSDVAGLDPPEPPAKMVILGAPIEYQVRFDLEPVGLDFDKTVRPIDELSYKPRNGWAGGGPFVMVSDSIFTAALPGSRTHFDALALANQSVYRWYRIKRTLPLIGTDGFWFPVDSNNYTNKISRDRIELLPYRVEATKDDLGFRVLLPATCYGEVERGSLNFKATAPGDEVKVPFTIDADRQLIQFSRYMTITSRTNNGASITYSPANLILECACRVKEKFTNNYRRFRYDVPLVKPPKHPGKRSDEFAVIRDDVRNWIRVNYIDAVSNKVNTTTSNAPECRDQAKYYAQCELAKFQVKKSLARSYNAIVPVVLDGALQSASWRVDVNGGVSTQISRDSELSVVALSYNVRMQQIETMNERRYYKSPGLTTLQARIATAKDFGIT